jgi:hypothetical protein
VNRVAGFATAVYKRLLRLYPAVFRDLFAEEMVWVFTMTLHDAAGGGALPLIGIFLREVGELPAAIVLEHIHYRRKQTMRLLTVTLHQDIKLVRLMTRLLSLLPIAFYSMIILFNDDVREGPAPAFIVWGLVTIFLMATWRWEKEGGTLVMVGAPIIAILFTLSGIRFDFPTIQAIFISSALALPYLIIGWLFYSIGQQAELAGPARPVDEVKAPRGRRATASRTKTVLAILAFGVVGILVLFMFGLGLFSASPQGQVVVPVARESCSESLETIQAGFPMPPPAQPLPRSLEGYELYSYQDQGEWIYALTAGIDRIQTNGNPNAPPAIVSTNFMVSGIDDLKSMLNQMPAEETITWCGFDRPGPDIIDGLKTYGDWTLTIVD